jgi:hypothetical protein
MAQPWLSRPGSRPPADRLNPRPEIIPDQDQPARQPDDVPPGTVPIHRPAWHHQKRTGPSRVGPYTDHLVMHRPLTWLCTVPAAPTSA